MRGSQRPRRRPPQMKEATQQEELPMRRTRSSSKLPPLQRSNSGTFFVSQYSPWRRLRKSERLIDGQQAPLNSDETVDKGYNKTDYADEDQDQEEVNLDEDEDTFSTPIDTSQRRSRLMRAFTKTFRRIAVWLAIFAMINYRYWTGKL